MGITRSEKRVAKALGALLPPANSTKKVAKPLEGLAGCQNIWKEPKSLYLAKKVIKPLEGLAGCQNIWKEPPNFYTKSKCRENTCSLCGAKGHNARTCTMKCHPCSDQLTVEMSPLVVESPPAQRKTELITFANGETITLDLGIA